MPGAVIVGAQWGDEGKGKVVDLYTPFADAVVRYGGGANAGHTLVVGGDKVVLHLVPSGALHPNVKCVLGHGTVIDPAVLVEELDALEGRGLLGAGRVLISDRAHLVLPQHKLVDGLREKGDGAIGTTKRGIGPAYEDKVARRGIRVGDLRDPARLNAKLTANLEAWRPVIAALGDEVPAAGPIAAEYARYGERLAPMIGDVSGWLCDALAAGKKVLFEGAQGAMLDVDHGTYPFVTSSTVIAGGACAGAGVGPTAIDRVIGISKAYATRVGGGPFPTELGGAEGEALRQRGAEFGATTGRPRRCGWLDAVALRYAVRINGISEIALTKLDVLTGLDALRVCVAYERRGERLDAPPWDGLDDVTPVYESMPGWRDDLSGCTTRDALPEATRRYIARIEALVGCRVGLVSVGADRDQTVGVEDPFRPR